MLFGWLNKRKRKRKKPPENPTLKWRLILKRIMREIRFEGADWIQLAVYATADFCEEDNEWKVLYSGIYGPVVRRKSFNVSEEHVASIFRAEE
jgi:hypothetical protein